jgi:hypothetical protein
MNDRPEKQSLKEEIGYFLQWWRMMTPFDQVCASFCLSFLAVCLNILIWLMIASLFGTENLRAAATGRLNLVTTGVSLLVMLRIAIYFISRTWRPQPSPGSAHQQQKRRAGRTKRRVQPSPGGKRGRPRR